MPVVFVGVFLVAIAIPFIVGLAIGQETSNPTVVDRAEAERIAKERGGRRQADSSSDSGDGASGDGRDTVDCDDRAPTADGPRIKEDSRDDEDEWGRRWKY